MTAHVGPPRDIRCSQRAAWYSPRGCGRRRPALTASLRATRSVIDNGCQWAPRAPSIAHIVTSWTDENEGNGRVTDQRNQHQLSNGMSVSDECNRRMARTRDGLQQIFLTCTGDIGETTEKEDGGRWKREQTVEITTRRRAQNRTSGGHATSQYQSGLSEKEKCGLYIC